MPDDPVVHAEGEDARLQLVPIGETREPGRASVVRRPIVNLLFTGQLSAGFGRARWLELVEAVVDSLEMRKLATDAGPMLWHASEPDSLWDPSAVKAGRFAAQHRVSYTAGRVAVRP